jgi:hypothetical protein
MDAGRQELVVLQATRTCILGLLVCEMLIHGIYGRMNYFSLVDNVAFLMP